MTDFNFDTALTIFQLNDEFPIDFDDAWQWLGWNKKQDGKTLLFNNFDEGIDFLRKGVKSSTGGRPSEWLVITIDCFKSMGMMVGTEQGKQIRKMLTKDISEYHKLKQIGLSEQSLQLSSDLLSIHNGKVVTDSLTLAEVFEKEHRSITREIRTKLRTSQNKEISDFYSNHVTECTYLDSMQRPQTKYLLTREGFSLIALGFTGEKAELFKIRYIEAFELMYKQLEGYALAHFFSDPTTKQLLYVIRNTITGLIKIGVTNNIKRRISQLECATGCELETVFCSVVADNTKEIEKELHQRFADFRQRGEWFDVDADLVINAITKLPFKLNN